MEQFISITGIAAPLFRANIDTDLLIPSRDITSTGKEGYGDKLLSPWRYMAGPDGQRLENPEFVLNRPTFRHAVTLIAGENFGSGSSREVAVWAIRQFGFRCVIAPSFGTIFRNNCYRNGVLPVELPLATVSELAREAESGQLALTVNLTESAVLHPDGRRFVFDVPSGERDMLLEGIDAIGLTLKDRGLIEAFQHADRRTRPWIWEAGEPARISGA